MKHPQETPFFFGRTPRLFGVLHEPAVAQQRTPFVFCHPFAEEKLWAHRVYVNFARELAQLGHPVLRFDYVGNGDSDGDFQEWCLEAALEDIGRAVDELKGRTSATEVGLLGLRLGASLAAQAAESRHDISKLILWAPIVDGHRYMQELLRVNLTTQMAVYREIRADREQLAQSLREGRTVNVDGYELSLALYRQLSEMRLNDRARSFAGSCLLVQLDRSDRARPLRELEVLRAHYSKGDLRFVQEEPFWKEIERFYDTAPNLFAGTLEWLRCQ
jgi:uncharacterized protein